MQIFLSVPPFPVSVPVLAYSFLAFLPLLSPILHLPFTARPHSPIYTVSSSLYTDAFLLVSVLSASYFSVRLAPKHGQLLRLLPSASSTLIHSPLPFRLAPKAGRGPRANYEVPRDRTWQCRGRKSATGSEKKGAKERKGRKMRRWQDSQRWSSRFAKNRRKWSTIARGRSIRVVEGRAKVRREDVVATEIRGLRLALSELSFGLGSFARSLSSLSRYRNAAPFYRRNTYYPVNVFACRKNASVLPMTSGTSRSSSMKYFSVSVLIRSCYLIYLFRSSYAK